MAMVQTLASIRDIGLVDTKMSHLEPTPAIVPREEACDPGLPAAQVQPCEVTPSLS